MVHSHQDESHGRQLVVWQPNERFTDIAEQVRRELSRRSDTILCSFDHDEDMLASIRATVRNEECHTVIAAGGDGTLNLVVNALLPDKTDVAVGVLPLGTGNDFARTAAVPMDPLEALAALSGDRTTRRMDVVRVETDDRRSYSINAVTGGFGGRIASHLTDEMKQFWGSFAYLRGMLEAFRELDPIEMEIRFDGAPAERIQAYTLVIGNGKTAGGGLGLAPEADPEDGLMDAVIVTNTTAVDMLTMSLQFLIGRHLDNERILHRKVRQFYVDFKSARELSVDGESVMTRKASFTIIPQAIRTVVGPLYGHPAPG